MGNWEASWIDTCPVIKKNPFLRCDNDSFTFYTSHNYIRCIYLYIPVLIIIWNDRCHITTCINQICVTSKKSNVNCFDDTEKSVFWFEFLSFYLNKRRTNKGYNCQDLKKKTWNIKRILSFVFLILFLLQEKQKNKNKWNFNYFGSDYFSFTESSHLQYLVSIVRRKISEWFYIEDKLSLVLFFLFTTYANGFYSVKWNIATSWTQWL